MSIRIKLLLILFTFTFIPLSLLSLLAIKNATQTIEHEVENALNNLVDEHVALIQDYLKVKEHNVIVLANLPMVANALEGLATVFAQGVTSPAYLSEDMEIRPALRQLKEQFNAYDLFLIAPNGDIIFTIIHEDDFATNLKTGPYRETLLASSFERAATLLESSVSPFEAYLPSQWKLQGEGEGEGEEKHSAFIAAPVFNDDRFLGVVAIQLNSNDYYHLATDYTGIGRTGEVVISKLEDNHAVIIAPLRRDPLAAFNLRYLIGSEIARPIQSSVLGEKGSGVSIGYEGTEILAAWRYIPEFQWGMVVKIETAEAFADAVQLKQTLLFLGIGIMLLAMLVAVFFSNKLSAPLVALIKGTEGIMKGDYNQQITIQTLDEVGQLGTSFNRMSAQLKQSLEEREQAKQALQQAHDTLEIRVEERTAEREQVTAELTQLIDTANAPIFGIDTEGKINEWNQQTAIITGYSKEDVMGRDLVENYITEDYKKPVKQVLDNALKGEELANYDFPLFTKDGKRLEILLNATTRRDMEGNITGVIGIGQDITELREKENALNQAQKMEAVGQLTGGIAHDFNNLLSIISGNLRFLQQDIGQSTVEINELFEDAMSAVDDGAELTQRLLGFSRSRSLQPEIKNVNDTIEKFTRFLSRTLGESLELDIDLPDDDLFINIDPSQLENALLNLSINARDAMPIGGKIIISAERYYHGDGDGDGDKYSSALSEGDYIKISVADTGTGIAAKDLQHVYEPFFTTKEVGKGSGLGLSMVYGFVQQSNGACYISSTPGKGTTVTMYFPEAIDDKVLAADIKDKNDLFISGSEVILIVEDEPRVRRVTLRDLNKLGYKTLEAENAAMAKTIIESGEHIDLLFSDVLMPGEMDGHMLGIWTEENYPQIKIVLTSGFSKGKADVSRKKAHPFPMIRKPYTIEKLAKQIRTTLAE